MSENTAAQSEPAVQPGSETPAPAAESTISTLAGFPEDLNVPNVPVAAQADTAKVAPTPPAEPENENFAALFEAQSTPGAHLSPGQRVTVNVVAVTSDTVFVSTGSKVDGIVERSELEEDGGATPQVGDTLDLYVVTVSSQEVRLSKMMRGAGGLAALEEAKEARLPVEGKVQAIVKGGFAVEVMKRRAFCPLGQMDLRPVENPESFVGKTLPFLITKLEKGGRNIVLSRRMILEEEQAENRDAFLSSVSVGDIKEGTVARLAPFGIFVELATGVEGLVHLSELTWGRVAQADEVVSVGDTIRVKVLEIATGEKGPRISLSVRQVMDDPWKTVEGRLEEGQIVTGKVVRNAAFGSFVEVLPGIDGLIHVSELSYERRINKPDDILSVGETVTVKIKGLDFDKKRLSLSLRDVGGDPWDGVAEDFPIGEEVTGTVEKRAPFGVFITLRPGVTGLLPASAISAARGKTPIDKAKVGDAVQIFIREVDAAGRKVTLGLDLADSDGGGSGGGRGRESREDKDWKKHAPKPAQPNEFGNMLGLAMQHALIKKK